jgi:hypothetical protein
MTSQSAQGRRERGFLEVGVWFGTTVISGHREGPGRSRQGFAGRLTGPGTADRARHASGCGPGAIMAHADESAAKAGLKSTDQTFILARMMGLQACKDRVTVPEQELDTLVLSALAGTLITGERLVGLLREATRHRREMVSQTAVRRQALKTSLKNIDAQLGRLLEAVAESLLPDMAALRSKVDQLNAERDECTRHLALLDAPTSAYRQGLSNRQAETVALTLKRCLLEAPKAIQRNYVRG